MPKHRKIRYKSSAIVLAVLAFGVFLPTHFINAQFVDPITGWLLDKTLASILLFFLRIVVNLISGLQALLTMVLKWGVLDSSNKPFEIVTKGWEIMRNFANMFFIVGLIIMAFATIFSISQYDFRKLIVKLLIAALLINFSLTIGTTIISWTQSFSNILLNSIGDFGNRLGEGLVPQELLLATSGPSFFQRLILEGPTAAISQVATEAIWKAFSTDQKTYHTFLAMFFSIIIGGIAVFALLVGVIVTIIRIPILMALLIISPLAWILSIMPQTTQWHRKWWSEFIGWNLFLPIYLFFIYFGIYFLTNLNDIFKSSNIDGKSPLIGIGWSFQAIFAYILAAIFLIGGAKIALNMKSLGGVSAVAAGTWAKSRAVAKFSTIGLAGMGAGYAWKASGAAGAYKEAKEHIQKEGFAGTPLEKMPVIGGYKGQRGLEDRQAKIAGMFGIPGVAQKQFERNAQYAEERFKKERYTEERLKGKLDGGSPEEKLAAANLLKSQFNYDLNTNQITELFEAQGGSGSANAVAWLRRQNLEDRSREDLEKLENSINDPELKRKIARAKAKRGFIPLDDQPDENGNIDKMRSFKRYLSLFGKDFDRASLINDSRDLIDGLKKDEALDLLEALEKTPGDTRESRKKLIDQIKDKGFFDEKKLRELTDRTSGIFESDSERERILDAAKKTNLLEALTIKKELGMLKDLYTREKIENPTDADVDKIMQQEFSVNITSVEDLAKIKSGVDKTTGKKFGFADIDDSDPKNIKPGRVLKAFQESLNANRQAANKVKNMYMDPKFTNNGPLVGYLDGALQEARNRAFMDDRGNPFKQKIINVTNVLIPEIEAAITANDISAMELALEKARGQLKQADNQLDTITDYDYVKPETKNELTDLLASARTKFNNIEAKTKTKREPKKKDNEPPPDNSTPPKGNPPSGGKPPSGGGSSGGIPPRGGSSRGGGGSGVQPTPRAEVKPQSTLIIPTPGAQFEMNLPEEERVRRGYSQPPRPNQTPRPSAPQEPRQPAIPRQQSSSENTSRPPQQPMPPSPFPQRGSTIDLRNQKPLPPLNRELPPIPTGEELPPYIPPKPEEKPVSPPTPPPMRMGGETIIGEPLEPEPKKPTPKPTPPASTQTNHQEKTKPKRYSDYPNVNTKSFLDFEKSRGGLIKSAEDEQYYKDKMEKILSGVAQKIGEDRFKSIKIDFSVFGNTKKSTDDEVFISTRGEIEQIVNDAIKIMQK